MNAKTLDTVIDEMRRGVPLLVTVFESGFGQARTGALLLLFGLLCPAFVTAAAARMVGAGLLLVGLLTVANALVVFRRRRVPVLVADTDGLCCTGLADPALPWTAVQSLTSLVAFGVLTFDIRLVSAATLPARSRFHQLVQRRRSGRLVIGGVMPRRPAPLLARP